MDILSPKKLRFFHNTLVESMKILKLSSLIHQTRKLANCKWICHNNCYPCAHGFLFFNFVMLLKWWPSIRRFSQIWLHSRYESRKKTESFYIFGYLPELIIKVWWLVGKKNTANWPSQIKQSFLISSFTWLLDWVRSVIKQELETTFPT